MLLRHFHTICAQLFGCLAPQEIVLLLSSCRTLRNHSEASTVALQRDPTTRHFYQRCLRDWCKTVPNVAREFDCTDHGGSHTKDPWKYDASLPASQRVALLSLAGLMASQLKGVIYRSHSDDIPSHCFQAVPFIFPTHVAGDATLSDLRTALNTIQPQLGDTLCNSRSPLVSEPGLHIENLTVHSETGSIVCAFCASMDRASARYAEQVDAYWDSRDDELERLQQQWRESGYDSSSDEYQERTNTHEQSMQASDELFIRRRDEERDSEVARLLLNEDRLLPALKLMTPKSEYVEMCVKGAVDDVYCSQLCPRVYGPLRRFIDTHGFQHVRRVDTTKYNGSDDLRRREIFSVEIVGGLAPHGFFAGVYLVEIKIEA